MFRYIRVSFFYLILPLTFLILSSGLYSFSSDDSYLSDLSFKRKYIKQWNSVEGLIVAYDKADNVYDKMFLAERLCFFLDNDRVFNFLLLKLSSEFLSFSSSASSSSKGADLSWKLRASIFRLLTANAEKLGYDERLSVLKQAKVFFREDKSNRVVVSSAFALVKLSSLDLPGLSSSSSHRLFKKRTIAYLFSDKLFSIKGSGYSPGLDYLVWGITKASLELGDSFVCYALSEVRKKKHLGKKVLAFIDKAIRRLNVAMLP